MPHIIIKSYPKHLTAEQKQNFAQELSNLLSQHLSTDKKYISIDYQEIPEQDWKSKVYDKEIAVKRASLLRQPDYQM